MYIRRDNEIIILGNNFAITLAVFRKQTPVWTLWWTVWYCVRDSLLNSGEGFSTRRRFRKSECSAIHADAPAFPGNVFVFRCAAERTRAIFYGDALRYCTPRLFLEYLANRLYPSFRIRSLSTRR